MCMWKRGVHLKNLGNFNMTTQELFDLTANRIITRINTSSGLTKFAQRRAKFEGWLKVELIDVLVKEGKNALPEVGFVDVSFDDVGIELKTMNTNIRYENVNNITKPITGNIESVVKDIQSLRVSTFAHKFVVFIVFPIEHHNLNWQALFPRITDNLDNWIHQEFIFENNVPGVIYYGKIN